MSQAAFELQNVTKRFRRQTALDGVSFSGNSGEVIAILGENGAGKTTAINILLGKLKADEGAAHVLGLDSAVHSQEIRQQVGYVPDEPCLYDWMTVGETGWFASGFYPSGYYERYCDLMTEYRVPLDKKIKQLSRGMKAKVSLALSLAHEPGLLILDEPTSGLDPLVRREFLESMVRVAAEGRTVLLASHQVAEVERVADAVVILIQGKLIMQARLDELKQSCCEVVLTGNIDALQKQDLPGEVISQETSGSQQQWLFLNTNEMELNRRFSQIAGLIYEIRTPSLEDVLLRLLMSSREKSDEQNAKIKQEEATASSMSN